MLDGRALMEETALAVESQPARLAQAAKKRLVHRNILRCLDSAPVIRELEGVRDILSRGNGADRQLRVFNANRDIVEVVSEIADATEVAAVPA